MAVRSADHDSAATGRTPVLRLTERRIERVGLAAATSDRPLIPLPAYRGRDVHRNSRPRVPPAPPGPPLD